MNQKGWPNSNQLKQLKSQSECRPRGSRARALHLPPVRLALFWVSEESYRVNVRSALAFHRSVHCISQRLQV